MPVLGAVGRIGWEMKGVPKCGLGTGDAGATCQAEGATDPLQGQDLLMILKKDTMSLVDPLDRSLIHHQPILNIRVWGVGCNNGRCQGLRQSWGLGGGSARSGAKHPSSDLSPLLPP